MIWLFTGARDDRPLYKRDLLNVCCEPEGAVIHFGYKKKWLPDGIKFTDDRRSTGGGLFGIGRRSPEYQRALIIFCEPAGGEAPFYRYHPLRLAAIRELREEWDSYTFILELKGFFDYEAYAPRQAEAFQKYIWEKGVSPGRDPFKWVRQEPDTGPPVPDCCWRPVEKDFERGAWLPLVERVSRLKGVSDSIFFSVQKRGTFGGPPSDLLPCKAVYDSGRYRFDVRGGKSYVIILYIIQGSEAEYTEVELKIGEDVASISGPFLRQRSSGMEADFNLVFKRSFQVAESMLELRFKHGDAKVGQVRSPEIQALIRIKVPWVTLLIAVAALALGGILAVVDPTTADELAKITGGGFGQWLSGNKVLFFMGTKVLALLSLGLGTFLGFNKLPITSG